MASGKLWRFLERRQADCGTVEPLLSLHVDGMTSAAEARRVEAHLPGCANCRQTLEWMQATHQVIAQRPKAEPPADLRARVARAIAEAEAAKSPAPVPAPVTRRPARRPLLLRPAFGYGLSLVLFAAVSGTIYWTDHPAGPVSVTPHRIPTTVAIRPPVTGPLPSRKSVIALPPKAHPSARQMLSPSQPLVAVRPSASHIRVFHPVPALSPEPQTVAMNVRLRRAMPPRIVPSVFAAPVLPHAHHAVVKIAPSAHSLLAARTQPPHASHLVTPEAITPAAPTGGSVVAVLPHSQGMPQTIPEKITVGTPLVTPDHTQVASYAPPSVDKVLGQYAVKLSAVPLKARRFMLSSKNAVAHEAADVSSNSSGTVAITDSSFP